jgi:hypothetical protein
MSARLCKPASMDGKRPVDDISAAVGVRLAVVCFDVRRCMVDECGEPKGSMMKARTQGMDELTTDYD